MDISQVQLHSESCSNVFKKIGVLQQNSLRVVKDAQNSHFKNKYTTFDTCMETLLPIINKASLALTQVLQGKILISMLVDTESGEWVKSYYVLPGGTKSQDMGSDISYGKRYSLLALVGGTAGDKEDDDGESSRTRKEVIDASHAKAELVLRARKEMKPQEYLEWETKLKLVYDIAI